MEFNFCLKSFILPKKFKIWMINLKFLIQYYFINHGLRTATPNEVFFYWNPELFGLGRQIGKIDSGAFGVFSAKLSATILVQSLVHVFHYSTIISTEKVSLYIHIPNIYLGLGFM